LTAAGCCHGDTALVEGIGSLREFHHLVQAGVPFPTDALGGFIGYKTDHDPSERATSAGPKTSKFMSECLVLGAVGSEGDVILLAPDFKIENGLRIG